jgi:hypothetical protein
MQTKRWGDFDPELVDAVIDPYLLYCSKGRSRPRPKEIQSWVGILRKAHTIVGGMRQFLHVNEADLNALTDVLKETAHALLDLGTAPGRSVETGLGRYAYELNNLAKVYYGKYKPEQVGKTLEEKKIPGSLKDNGKRDMAEWAKTLAKRHREFRMDSNRQEIASFRSARVHLAQRLGRKLADHHPKTLSFYYGLSKREDAKFWPDELPSHDPKKCPMCSKRRQRARNQRQTKADPKPNGSGPLDEYSRSQFWVILTVKLTNRLESKLKTGAITKETFEQFAGYPYQSELHQRLCKAETVEEARKIVDSVNEYVECYFPLEACPKKRARR